MNSVSPLETTSVTPPGLTRRVVSVRPPSVQSVDVGGALVQQSGVGDGVGSAASQRTAAEPGASRAPIGGASADQSTAGPGVGPNIGGGLTGSGPPINGESAVAVQISASSPDQTPPGLQSALARDVGGEEAGPGELTEAEEEQVRQLQERDREVRAHEQAHARVGGQYAGAPQYDFVTGPDGRQYAVSGSVSIDVSPIPNDPEATADKAETVRRAALAPAEPSAQDRAVAAEATELQQEAQREIRARQSAERQAQLDAQNEAAPSPADALPGFDDVPSDVSSDARFVPQTAGVDQPGNVGQTQPFSGAEAGASPAALIAPVIAAAAEVPAFEATPSATPSGASVLSRRVLSEATLASNEPAPSEARPGSLINLSV